MTKDRLRDYRAIAQEKKALEHQIETDDLVAGHQALHDKGDTQESLMQAFKARIERTKSA